MKEPPVPETHLPYGTGAFPLPIAEAFAAGHTLLAPPAGVVVYPSVSWERYATPVGSQGIRGECVGWGCTAANEIITGVLLDKVPERQSPQDLYGRALQYDGLSSWRQANNDPEGTWVWAAADALRLEGVALEVDCPYNQLVKVHGPDPAVRLTPEYRIAASAVCYSVEGWKAALQKGPLAVVVTCDNALFAPKDGYIVDVDGSSAYNSAHCLCLVGYNADTGRFRAKGSWGTYYGQGGYIELTEAWVALRGADATLFTPDLSAKIAGDANADTRLNFADALEALFVATGQRTVTPFVSHTLDVCGHDGKVNVQDAMQLLRQTIGLA